MKQLLSLCFFIGAFTVSYPSSANNADTHVTEEKVYIDQFHERISILSSSTISPDGSDNVSTDGKKQPLPWESLWSEGIKHSMGKGWFEATKSITKACISHKNGDPLHCTNEVHKVAADMRKQIAELTNFIQTTKLQILQEQAAALKKKSQDEQSQKKTSAIAAIEPVAEWAQSKDSVFISVKFAHKIDAPACIDLVDEKVSILRDKIIVSAECKGQNKAFKFEIDLYSSIKADESSWARTSVGRGTFTLKKLTGNQRWPRLVKSETKPKNISPWWAMKEKYAEEMEEFERKAEEEQDRERDEREKEEDKKAAEKEGTEEEDKKEKKAKANFSDYMDAVKKKEDIRKKYKEKIDELAMRFNREKEKLQEEEEKEAAKIDKELQNGSNDEL